MHRCLPRVLCESLNHHAGASAGCADAVGRGGGGEAQGEGEDVNQGSSGASVRPTVPYGSLRGALFSVNPAGMRAATFL